MFSNQPKNSIQELGESGLIQQIRIWLGPVAPPPPAGMGDDCAVLNSTQLEQQQLLTTDSVSHGQHFDDSVSARDAGAKLIKRNLSDIAAMGGQPGPALLNLLCGPNLSIDWLQEFVSGLRESCENYGVTIVGGDVSQLATSQFTAALTLTGFISSAPALRSTASVGDAIYVCGTLGGSILGKHYRFEPRLQQGQWLATQPECTAMMDITDGLGKDLAALLPEGSSASIELNQLPISADARECARDDERSAEEHAFCDGEDYELLFTISGGSDSVEFESKWKATFPTLELSRIGKIIEASSEGIYIDATSSKTLPWQSGFEHFKSV